MYQKTTNHILISLQCNFEDVSLLSLCQEEEHALCLVSGTAHKQHPPLRVIKVISAAGNGTSDVWLISKVLVSDVVL